MIIFHQLATAGDRAALASLCGLIAGALLAAAAILFVGECRAWSAAARRHREREGLDDAVIVQDGKIIGRRSSKTKSEESRL